MLATDSLRHPRVYTDRQCKADMVQQEVSRLREHRPNHPYLADWYVKKEFFNGKDASEASYEELTKYYRALCSVNTGH